MSSPLPPAPHSPEPYYGYAGVGFRGIGAHLLKEFPPIAAPEPPPPVDPTESGFAARGPELLAPMVSGPGGSRATACPVWLTAASVPRPSLWARLRKWWSGG